MPDVLHRQDKVQKSPCIKAPVRKFDSLRMPVGVRTDMEPDGTRQKEHEHEDPEKTKALVALPISRVQEMPEILLSFS